MYGVGLGCCCFKKMGFGYDGAATLMAFRHATNGDGLVISEGNQGAQRETIDQRNTKWKSSQKLFELKDAEVNCMAGKSGGRSIDVENRLQAPTMVKLEQDKGFS
ncbi:BAHD acyltransferase DCR-like [Pyrus ussuriensis x Pyrus communis]|uniref:BAHD acyltransferase DCR-like n=1 Tax=Pyrus ussuriensis x Pyrus communis TaxID=2448454 RepID=A0A5N5GXF3_9ROSA|nr:BAHD acyltransferase DCR-like [Pyrus ussuriensis x Pyrus communis]